MQAGNPYAKYGNNAVLTATKEELTLMLYDGALKFINQALMALEKKDYENFNRLIQRVQDIIREFQITLDKKYEISQNLDALYDYINRLLIDGNIQKNAAPVEEARELLRDLRDTWKEAMKLAKQQN